MYRFTLFNAAIDIIIILLSIQVNESKIQICVKKIVKFLPFSFFAHSIIFLFFKKAHLHLYKCKAIIIFR